MNVISRKLSNKLKSIGLNQDSQFYYNKVDKYSRLCVKTKAGDCLVIKGPKMSTILPKNDTVSSAFTLSEINGFLKYYSKYFTTYFDVENSCWKINKDILKLYFMNQSNRKFMDDFIDIHQREYTSEVEAKGELLLFLIKSKFINPEDLNN